MADSRWRDIACRRKAEREKGRGCVGGDSGVLRGPWLAGCSCWGCEVGGRDTRREVENRKVDMNKVEYHEDGVRFRFE